MATETTKRLIKLLNRPNYATWKLQCKMALIKEGMWNIVTGNENVSENQEEHENTCCEEIVLSVDPTLLYLLGPDTENRTVVWKQLADQFQGKKWANKLALRRKMYNLKLKDGQSMQKHVKMLAEVFDELSVIGDSLDEENQVVHL